MAKGQRGSSPKSREKTPGPYVCPGCGRTFSRRPIEHTCARLSVDAHFAKSEPWVREAFDRIVRGAKSCGPVQVSALKTMIALNAPAMMGGVSVQRQALKLFLILPWPREHATLRRRQEMSAIKISHEFALKDAADFDGALEELVREAWELAAG